MRALLLAIPLVVALAAGVALVAPRLADALPEGARPDKPPGAPADPTPPPLVAPPENVPGPVVAPKPSNAKIVFKERTFDWGSAPHGSVITHAFAFKNEGTETLEIVFVRASCGCTAAQPSKTRLGPGEGGEIAVAFDSAKKHLAHAKQRFVHAVTVRSNDMSDASGGTPGNARLSLEGDIVARYQLIPDAGLVFSSFPRGAEPPTATVEIIPSPEPLPGEAPSPGLLLEGTPGVAPTATARILSLPPHLELVSLAPVVRDGRAGVAISARPKRGAPIGTLDGMIRIATGNPSQPELQIPTRGYVSPAVQAIPPKLILPLDLGDAPRPVRIIAPGNPRILAIEVVPEGGGAPPLTAQSAAPGAGVSGVQIHVRPSPELGKLVQAGKTRGCAGDVLVFLDSAEHGVVRVPYILRDLGGQVEELAAQRAAGVRVSPPELFLGDIPPPADLEGTLVVLKNGGAAPPLDARDIRIEPEGLFSPRVDTLKPGEVQRLMFRLMPHAPGAFFGRITFKPREGGPELSVGVCGRILPSVEVEPAAFALTASRRTAEVTITRTGGAPWKVLAAEEITKRVAVEAIETDEGPVRVRVSLDAAASLAGLRGVVIVVTDVEGAEEVRIPLVGLSGK